jgi:hypothetical protein
LIPRTNSCKRVSQIPGKDFQENHLPAVNFHTILVFKILLKLEAGNHILYGDLEESLWMELPDRYVYYINKLTTNGKQN